jgi:endonuclease/exonuclease/phosphatase family metal-dependent hydrolase
MTEFTYGSYNLENGGIDNGDDSRLRRQLAMLAQAGADGWALQECKGFTASGYRALFLAEDVLGMRAFLVPSAHHGCDLAVFVAERSGLRVTGVRHERGDPYWHAVARVITDVRGFGPLHLVSAHLAPSSPAKRLIEAEALALIAKDGMVIAGGDWNAVPAGDPDPPLDGIDAGHARRKLDRSAARAIEEAGFTDAAAHLGHHAPTVGHATDKLAYRCDRIYTTLPATAITGYQLITEDQTASDHRPVLARFRLSDPAGQAGADSREAPDGR